MNERFYDCFVCYGRYGLCIFPPQLLLRDVFSASVKWTIKHYLRIVLILIVPRPRFSIFLWKAAVVKIIRLR